MRAVRPVRYRVHLEPNLNTSLFSGTVEAVLELVSPQRQITMNALELAVWSCSLRLDGGGLPCPFTCHPGREEITVELPREMAGEIVLKIDYTGKLNEKMAGFYISRYTAGGSEGLLAVTQFEESDARRAFPCIDHPADKAVFETELVIPEGLSAISNGPAIEEEKLADASKRVRFLATPRMSTYLVFFGVGAFEFLEDAGQDVLIRIAASPGMAKYGQLGLEFGRQALRYCEHYYGIPYPLPKLDLIAVADFAFGAMENWGAITFRENLLLHVPGMTSRAAEERMCEVIAHEIAHQWFGNLVTPSDWKYLWLNESFATYFGFGAVDHSHPDWGVWEEFIHAHTDRSLFRDALLGTVPIEIPGGEHVVINEVTAPIIYSKGGSILRQVETYVGSEDFRAGLHLYLERHAYGSAASHDLWEALEEVSGKPVTRLMKSWVEQPGHPLIEVSRTDDRLQLRQKRFTFLPSDSGQRWLTPVTIRIFRENGSVDETGILFEDEVTDLPLGRGAAAYQLNAGHAGYYRVLYRDRRNLDELGRRVQAKALSAQERSGLHGDLHALLLAGRVTFKEYLQFLSFYEHEEAYLPLIGIADSLYGLHLVLDAPLRTTIAETGRRILERVLARIGYEPAEGETHNLSVLRDEILFHAALYGSREAVRIGRAGFTSLQEGGFVHADVRKAVMQVGALCDGGAAFEYLTRQLSTTDSEHERMNLLSGLGSFGESALILRALDYILKQVPLRNRFIPLCRLGVNPHAGPLLWDWFVKRLDALEQLHPVHFERVVAGVVPFCGAGREEEVKEFLHAYVEKKQKLREVAGLALERLEIYRRLKQMAGPAA